MIEQALLKASKSYEELDIYFIKHKVHSVFLVCGSSITSLRINSYFENLQDRLGIKVVRFSDFKPNPRYESVVAGLKVFHQENCDMIIAVGGGSAIDVAKCIKLYSNMDTSRSYLLQEIIPNKTKLLVIPTTAGTGSESTRYAVIYYQGEKLSISDYSCIPSTVLMDSSTLKTLPLYQKKVTMMDALCHSIESFWSIHSTDESKQYSKNAIQLIIDNMDLYLDNNELGITNMLEASNLAGRAINITQTTAGHAMCYKLTNLYGIAHGHAVSLCVEKLWPYMIQNLDKCTDSRGPYYLKTMFNELADIMKCENSYDAIDFYTYIIKKLELTIPVIKSNSDYELLNNSVNLERLNNNPIRLDKETIKYLYHQILSRG